MPAWCTAAQTDPATTAANAHACEMFQFFRQMTGGNFGFSPYSSHQIAALLTGAAKGGTQTELAALAHLDADLPQSFQNLETLHGRLVQTAREGGLALEISNSLWSTQARSFDPAFVVSIGSRFGASLQQLPAGDAVNCAMAVNRWVREKTHGRLTDMVGPNAFPIPGRTLLVINTMYMKGIWADGFEPRFTQMRPFYRAQEKLMRPTMHMPAGTLWHGQDKDWLCLGIPLAGKGASLVILLPRDEALRPKIEQGLTPAVWQAVVRSLYIREVNAMVPRFSYSTRLSLKPLWEALGAKQVFAPGMADLSTALKVGGTFVSDVLHETTIEVNEKGAIASAATIPAADPFGEVDDRPRPPPRPSAVPFVANRPFLWMLRHDVTDLILFMGRYAGD